MPPSRSIATIPGLDGLRAISILIVMVSHAGLQGVVPGVFGVTVFFCISGYLITRLLLDEFEQSGSVAVGAFYVRRALRLYPPLIAYVAVMAGVMLAGGERPDLLGLASGLFYFANYVNVFAPHRLDGVGGHLWSLSVEEHFYAVYPLLLLALLASGRRLVPVLLGVCALSLACRVAVSGFAPSIAVDYTGMATECRIEGILAGAIAAVISRRSGGAAWLRDGRGAVAALPVLALTFAVRDPLFRQTIRYTIQEAALIPILLTVVAARPETLLHRAMNSAPLAITGKLSYSLYLWHFAGYEIALALVPGAGWRMAVAYMLGIALAFGMAFASYQLVEQPVFSLRRRFGSHVRPPADTDEAAVPQAASSA